MATVGAALFVPFAPAVAQDVRAPEGPIEIVVGQSAGSTPDVMMRRAAQVLNETGIIENPIVVQNRTGGAWSVAFQYVLDRPGDENVMLAIAEPVFATPIVQGSDTVSDQVTPLAIFAQTQILLMARPGLEYDTMSELIEYARANQLGVKMSGTAVDGTSHQITGLVRR